MCFIFINPKFDFIIALPTSLYISRNTSVTRIRRSDHLLSDYRLSLINGINHLEGTILVKRSNLDREGTICDDDWSQAEADVACRQLGYLSANPNKSKSILLYTYINCFYI